MKSRPYAAALFELLTRTARARFVAAGFWFGAHERVAAGQEIASVRQKHRAQPHDASSDTNDKIGSALLVNRLLVGAHIGVRVILVAQDEDRSQKSGLLFIF